MFNVDEVRELLSAEVIQRREEGCDVAGWDARVRKAPKKLDTLLRLYDALMRLKPDAALARREPSDLEGIRRRRPKGPRRLRHRVSRAALRDRLRGAMLGRCAGCLLGKPVELWSRDRIFAALKADRCFPLDDYFRRSTIRRGDPQRKTIDCVRETIHCMERDDDIDYTILGIHYLKRFGPGFSTRDVGGEWLYRLPYYMTYTAERVAYRNLIDGVPIGRVATRYNPYREWIGAQIRADGFGYCAAGRPELAAEFAHRDASLSHVRNGMYGEMLFAAMVAAAAVVDDVAEAIAIGLSEIPADCRLARAVRDVIEWVCTNGDDWLATLDAIHARYGQYNAIHTINNAALVIMALLHGRYDFGRTITMAVMGGWDTDCNGATAGSVLGAILGAKRLPSKWIGPLQDRVRSHVIGYDNRRITELADEAWEVSGTMNDEQTAFVGSAVRTEGVT